MSAAAHRMPGAVTVVEVSQNCPCCGQPRPTGRLFDIAQGVAGKVYGTSLREIRSEFRSDGLTASRALVVWALRALGRGHSYPAIARLLSRDHSTIIYLHRKALRLRLTDERFHAACATIAFQHGIPTEV